VFPPEVNANLSQSHASQIVSLGIPGLDNVLGGGLPLGRLYLIQGEPLNEFQGILTGVPNYRGEAGPLLKRRHVE
jgi:hypothetical protein